jgi:hypothetical protein
MVVAPDAAFIFQIYFIGWPLLPIVLLHLVEACDVYYMINE